MAELGNVAKTVEAMLEHKLFEMKYPNIQFAHDLLRESLLRNARENNRFKDHHMICADMLRAYFSDALTFYHERRAEHLYAANAWEACIDPLLQAAKLRQQRCEFSTGYMLLQQRETAIDNCHADADSPIRALGWLAQANALLQEARLDEARPSSNAHWPSDNASSRQRFRLFLLKRRAYCSICAITLAMRSTRSWFRCRFLDKLASAEKRVI